MRGAFLIWVCLTAMPALAAAQVNGVVADTLLKRRVPGAVVTMLDASGRVVGRALADDSGRFRIDAPSGGRMRIVKIGYRPVELPVSSPSSHSIVMQRLPNLLEPVRTSDQPRCTRNPTRPAAFGLWEQARAALLGTVLAREANTAMVRRISYRRYMTPLGNEIASQSVHRDSGLALRSFEASYPAEVFMRTGFAEPTGVRQVQFYGPDAEVLLDDALVAHYCLELATPRPDRATQVGLRFRPMGRAKARVDVDGTLWIDTLARVLTDIEYGYLGLENWATEWRPGGVIGFVEASPAAVWIDRWHIRMTGAKIDSGQRQLPDYTRKPLIIEAGAELASAQWPDGREWKASLGTVDLKVVSQTAAPMAWAQVRLDSTDYGGITDKDGRVTIDALLPGPYRVSVFDSLLAVVDTALPGSRGFTAARGTTVTETVLVPTMPEFVKRGCIDQDAYQERSMMLVARIVIDTSGVPAAGVKWRLEPVAGESNPDPNAPADRFGEGQTGNDGMVFFCTRLIRGRRIVLRAWSPSDKSGGSGTAVTVVLRNPIEAVKLAIPR